MKVTSNRSALTLIVLAQFLGTSLWFAGNAVVPELSQLLEDNSLLAPITSAVQFGFISGTFFYALFSIPDRFSPIKVFLTSAILASASNLMIIFLPLKIEFILVCRFFVGVFLAGIYPVGMKIAADYFEKGLGTALGYLVGALVLGTAFPHLIQGLDLQLSWKIIFICTSVLAIIGGLLIYLFVSDGPFRKKNQKFEISLIPKLSRITSLKSAASGYFGHMWELYTFWAFVPIFISFLYGEEFPQNQVSFLSFLIIAIGGVSCVFGGILSTKFGSKNIALFALLGSCVCCLLAFFVPSFPSFFWIIFLLAWGILVTADSPQFSTLVSHSVPAKYKGTALTLVNCLGFALSIVSIQVGQYLLNWIPVNQMLALLGIGPLIGLFLFKLFQKPNLLT
ncbi:MFS transporter [Algoriphagus machipongonensis]|uniref:Major facilitator superfamily transporter n=1 Tax=Algoriphagus machipongonensis TaxID=388413 RepID=A3HRT8_9BACT|nr:MFS transporter [Algoriphagus machipongonensis]EAZ82556.1 major facilitator superfamily transporter [Algoriphagus machipongonensis]